MKKNFKNKAPFFGQDEQDAQDFPRRPPCPRKVLPFVDYPAGSTRFRRTKNKTQLLTLKDADFYDRHVPLRAAKIIQIIKTSVKKSAFLSLKSGGNRKLPPDPAA